MYARDKTYETCASSIRDIYQTFKYLSELLEGTFFELAYYLLVHAVISSKSGICYVTM